MALLIYSLRRKLTRLGLAGLARTLLVLVPAAVLTGGVAALLGWLWDSKLGHATLPLKLGAVFVPGAIAGLVYWLIAFYAKVPAAHEVMAFLRKLGRASE